MAAKKGDSNDTQTLGNNDAIQQLVRCQSSDFCSGDWHGGAWTENYCVKWPIFRQFRLSQLLRKEPCDDDNIPRFDCNKLLVHLEMFIPRITERREKALQRRK